MNLVLALTVGALVGAAVRLVLRGDTVRLAAGTLLLTNAALLLLVAPGLGSGHAPILPVGGAEPVADPLAQALALTAAVIGFGTTVLLLRLVLALAETHDTLLLEDLAEAERDEPEGDA